MCNMTERARSVLYVRLPCWKIYPGGVIYVADYIHKQRPDIDQHIVDLALVEPRRRKAVLRERLRSLRPDVVAFSWRNMQSFGPHPEDDALDVVMQYEFSPNPLRRLRAAWGALSIIYDYARTRLHNFAYMKMVRRLLPKSRVVVGGTAVSIFGRYVAEKCPVDSIVVVGEGEDAMLSIVDGFREPAGEFYYKDADGRVSHRAREGLFDLEQLTAVDFPYIESIFPDFHQHLDADIGVQTKRGCPYQCHFCLYNRIEGPRQRNRDPAEIAREIESLNRRYGVRRIWFTDAQFLSSKRSARHAEAVLDEILARGLDVQWSGYVRLNYLTPLLADKMVRSGLSSIDLSFTGSQDIIDSLTLGYSLEQQMSALAMFREAGYTDQKVKLYMPLNAPGENCMTLRDTIAKVEQLYAMFGKDNVLPFIFFIGIQPGTPVERLLIEQGYLRAGYDPLSLNPFVIKRLLYNPPPLGPLIGRAYLEAVAQMQGKGNGDYIGRVTMDILARKLAQEEEVGSVPSPGCAWSPGNTA